MQRERALSLLYAFPMIGMAIWSGLVHRDKTERELRDRWPDLEVIDRHKASRHQERFDGNENYR